MNNIGNVFEQEIEPMRDESDFNLGIANGFGNIDQRNNERKFSDAGYFFDQACLIEKVNEHRFEKKELSSNDFDANSIGCVQSHSESQNSTKSIHCFDKGMHGFQFSILYILFSVILNLFFWNSLLK